jgi:hypothetical protein
MVRPILAQIVIQNAGVGTAEDLRLTFDPPLQSTQAKDSLQFFNTPQPMVPPGFRHVQTFDTWGKYLDSELPRQYQVTASYKGAENQRSYEVHYVLDAESMRWRHTRQSDVEIVRDEMKSIRESLQQGFKQLTSDLTPMLRLQAFARPSPLTKLDAVKELLGTWELMKVVENAPSAYYPSKSMLEFLRVQVLAIAHDCGGANAVEEQVTAVDTIIRVVFDHRAEFGQTDWVAERNAAFEQLMRTFLPVA